MNKIMGTVLLKSGMAIPHFTCFSNTEYSKNVRTQSNQRHTEVSRYAPRSLVDCGCKGCDLRKEKNYIDTVARTRSLQNRPL